MEVVSILPQPLGIVKCPFHDEVKELIKQEIVAKQDGKYVEISPNSDELVHIDYYSVLDRPQFLKLREWVEEQATIFMENVLGEYVQEGSIVTDSWINICDKGGSQAPHYHTNSYVTALYYVNFNGNEHVPTYFAKTSGVQLFPNNANLTLPQRKNTRYNQMDQVIAEEGDLFLWPSHIIHGYKRNEGDNRVTIAINVMPKMMTNGDYGWKVERLNDEDRLQAIDRKREGDLWWRPDFE